jgi:hypothetical protein
VPGRASRTLRLRRAERVGLIDHTVQARAQLGGNPEIRQLATQCRAGALEILLQLTALRAALNVPFDLDRRHRVDFIVEISLHTQ